MRPMDYKSHISGIYDRTASSYGGFGTHFFDIFAERLIALAHCFPGANILDVATGRGAILKRAIQIIGMQGKAIGIDISPKMIEQTKREIHQQNVSLYCMDAEELSFEDRSFDIVYCGFALFFFPNPKKALQEFKRVLKPQGKIAVSTWGKTGLTRRILQEKLSAMGAEPSHNAHPMPSHEDLSALFSDAGFQSIQIKQEQLDHTYANFDHWWECLWHHGTRAGLEQLNEEQLGALKNELDQALESVNRPDGFHEELEVYYTVAST